MRRELFYSQSVTKLYSLSLKLKRGELSEVAEMTGYSVSHVSNVIADRRKDTDGKILQAIKLITKGRKY